MLKIINKHFVDSILIIANEFQEPNGVVQPENFEKYTMLNKVASLVNSGKIDLNLTDNELKDFLLLLNKTFD